MKRKWQVVFAGAMLLFCAGCRENKPDVAGKKVERLKELDKGFVDGQLDFALKAFREIEKERAGQNTVVSPLSLSIAMGMTYNGSLNRTREALGKTLGYDGWTPEKVDRNFYTLLCDLSERGEGVTFASANSAWGDPAVRFHDEFVSDMKSYFGAQVTNLDFANPESLKIINKWVEKSTGGKIPVLLRKIDSRDALFLINAIYFKGIWKNPFDPELTKDWEFNLSAEKKVATKMMFRDGEFDYLNETDFRAVKLPYGKDSGVDMVLFLPHPGVSLDTWISGLSREKIDLWMGEFENRKGRVGLPRFSLDCETRWEKTLTALGAGVIFTPEADFNRLAVRDSLFVNFILQRAKIEVNEEGSEATAATVVAFTRNGHGPFMFILDRPFFFMIYDQRNRNILFLGKVVEPEI